MNHWGRIGGAADRADTADRAPGPRPSPAPTLAALILAGPMLAAPLAACATGRVDGPGDRPGGPDGGARDAAPDPGDFALRPEVDVLALTPREPRGFVRFLIDRRGGFGGIVEVTATDLPRGISATTVRVPPGRASGVVALERAGGKPAADQGRYPDVRIVARTDPPGGTESHTLRLVVRGDPGDPDETYGDAGVRDLDVFPGLEEAALGPALVRGSGRVLVTTTARPDRPSLAIPRLAALGVDGALDPAFGVEGVAAPPDDGTPRRGWGVFPDADPDAVVWLVERGDGARVGVRLSGRDAALRADLGFDGDRGTVGLGDAIRIVPLASDAFVHALSLRPTELRGLAPGLVVDTDWGVLGRYPPAGVVEPLPTAVAALGDGGVLVAGAGATPGTVLVRRLDPRGREDDGYGGDGTVTLGAAGAAKTLVQDPGTGGAVLLLEGGAETGILVRLDADGRRDGDFGIDGRGEDPGIPGTPIGLLRLAGGGLLGAFDAVAGGGVALVRWTSRGRLDPGFGAGGVLQWPGDPGHVVGLGEDPERDRLLLVTSGGLADPGPTVRVRALWR